MWALLIVNDLLSGSKRFGELLASIESMNPQTLSQRLKMLEAHHFITREAYAEIPPRVEYHLTEKGRGMASILQALTEFGESYLTEMSASSPASLPVMEPPTDE